MARFRPILGIILAAIATFIVSCGGAAPKQPLTYTPEILQRVQIYAPAVNDLRDRFPELQNFIQEKDWVDVSSFIHGPLGEMRFQMNRLASTLLPKDADQAKQLAKEVYVHLERLDQAASEGNQVIVGQEYRNALDDFDAFLNLIPSNG
ncbi:MAG: photosystem II protein PsbQ [Cyanobacteria bacterium Co-bin13]|nr:photosystem II protein PsbQ [Cyanobacteria bacterium Co-bin13]